MPDDAQAPSPPVAADVAIPAAEAPGEQASGSADRFHAAKRFWQEMGPEVEARARRARIAAVDCSGPFEEYPTMDDDAEQSRILECLNENAESLEQWECPSTDVKLAEVPNGVRASTVDNRWDELRQLESFDAFEPVPRDRATDGKLIKKPRC